MTDIVTVKNLKITDQLILESCVWHGKEMDLALVHNDETNGARDVHVLDVPKVKAIRDFLDSSLRHLEGVK